MTEIFQATQKKDAHPLQFTIDDILEGEKMLKLLENKLKVEELKKNYLTQKITQSKSYT